MEERSSQVPPQNWILFFVLAAAILYGYPIILQRFAPKRPQAVAKMNAADLKAGGKAGEDKSAPEKPALEKAGDDKANGAGANGAAAAGKPGGTASKPATADSATSKTSDNQASDKQASDKQGGEKLADGKSTHEKPAGDKSAEAVMAAAPPAKFPTEWFALGSLDPSGPYRMLVTVGNRGAAIARVELNNEHYHDLNDWTGYLGHLVVDTSEKPSGCVVQVVGDGTPAAKAGIQTGDRIVKIDGAEVVSPMGLESLLGKTKPGQKVDVTYNHKGDTVTKNVALIRRPLEIVRPEEKFPRRMQTNSRRTDATDIDINCPLSLLMTLQQVDKNAIAPPDEAKEVDIEQELSTELKDVRLRDANWEVVRHDQESVEFRAIVRVEGHDALELRKRYTLAKPNEKNPASDPDAQLYHLDVSLEIKNIDKTKQNHEVAYRLDGPTGLPDEGSWYASKVGLKSGCGLRDIVYKMTRGDMAMFTATQLADKPMESMFDGSQVTEENRPTLIGVDGQYFAAVLLPNPDTTGGNIDRGLAMCVGKADTARKTLTNTSFRIISKPTTLAADKSLAQSYSLFVGPKQPVLLRHYDIESLIYYGWFGPICIAMKAILDFFNSIFHNFGIAIIGLTVMVRMCMFPLSRVQTKNVQMMQKMQPEMKRINDKYKNDLDGKNKAVNDLYKKHGTNQFAQLGGCLLLFLQLPIFFGMYRALQINVELRDAPLISESVRWCSNLAAPDMLIDWSRFMPEWFNSGIGSMFALGPYFNVLPVLTIGMFLAQQKLLMPPPADEAAAMQQKMMNYMMIFMLLMFYRVASGLCIYSIASTLWGLAERQLLPKKTNDDGEPLLSTESPYTRPSGGDSDSGGDSRRRKKRRK